MDSDMGSQDQEAIAKCLEDSIGSAEDNSVAASKTVMNLEMLQSQAAADEKGGGRSHPTKLAQNQVRNGVLGGLGAIKSKKRNYEEIVVQKRLICHQMDNCYTQEARTATAAERRESLNGKRLKFEDPQLLKRKSQIVATENQNTLEKEMAESFKIPYNESQMEGMDQEEQLQNEAHHANGCSEQIQYKLDFIREPNKGNARSFSELLQDFAQITLSDQRNEQGDQQIAGRQEAISCGQHNQIKKQINLANQQKLKQDYQSYVTNANLLNLLKVTDLLINNNARKKEGDQDYTFEVIDVNKLDSFQDSYDEDDLLKIVQIMIPKNHKPGIKIDQRFHCNQQMFRRVNADGNVSLVWCMHNVGAEEFINKPDDKFIKHYVESGLFQSLDGYLWKLRFQPGNWPPNQLPTGQNQKSTRSKICLFAIPTPEERQKKKMHRQVSVKFGLFQNSKVQSLKHWCFEDWEFKNETGEQEHRLHDGFCQISNPRQMRMNGTFEQFPIIIQMSHQVRKKEEEEDGERGEKHQQQIEETKPKHIPQLFKGLKNEGTTCYLNSVIQALFFIRPFRNAIYRMPTITIEKNRQKLEKSIPFCLQRIFYNLQLGDQQKYVRTHELLQAFGWDINDINQQQDVSEFNQILSEQLDKQMENTSVQGTFQQLFEGEIQNVMKCINVDYESTRKEKFLTIQLNVKGNQTIQDSIREYISEERLEGKNQYETPKHGKQDAVKFIRFKHMPPILQIQLRRYDFDPNVGNFVKSNQQLKFQEILDFESIKLGQQVSNANGQAASNINNNENHGAASEWSFSQTTQQKPYKNGCGQNSVLFSQYAANNNVRKNGDPIGPTNTYHLHSILVHRGSINSGHYFAFIKPTLEDRWYEFNDDRVTEVTKEFAFGQGIGGDNCSFELKREPHLAYPDSTSMLIERHRENFTNAYMLIYIRDHERASILDDERFTLDKQIPPELQMHFKIEELFKDQIKTDWAQYRQFYKVYLIADDLLQQSKWAGSSICPKLDDKRNPEEKRFEADQDQHLLLQVHHHMCLNEFIVMLRDRFFNASNGYDDIDLEDIWLYRIFQSQKNYKTMIKLTYSLENKYDCPLFTKNFNLTTADWEQTKQKNEQKWKNSSLNRELTLYLKINPKKLKADQKLLRRMTEQEREDRKQHYNGFIDYIHKTDMVNGPDYIYMYEEFQESNFTFAQPLAAAPAPQATATGAPTGTANEARSSSVCPDALMVDVEGQDPHHDQIMTPTEERAAKTKEGPATTTESRTSSYWDQIVRKNRSKFEKEREGFLFQRCQRLTEEQRRGYEEIIKDRDQTMRPPPQKQMDCLCFVKIARADSKDIEFAFSYLMDSLDEPLNCDGLIQEAGKSPDDYDIFIDPYSNNVLRSQNEPPSTQYNENFQGRKGVQQQGEQITTEQYRQLGLKKFTQHSTDIFKLIPQQLGKVPFSKIVKPNKHGLGFILYPKIERDADKSDEEMERKQVFSFNKRVQWHENLVYVHLKYVHDMDGYMNSQRQVSVGTFQFNNQFTSEQIINTIVEHFTAARVQDPERLPIPEFAEEIRCHIQLFNGNTQIIPYQELIQSAKYDDNCQPLVNMLNPEHELNFTVIGPPLNRIDREDVARFTVHDDSSLVRSHATTHLRQLVQRAQTMAEFLTAYSSDIGAFGKNNGLFEPIGESELAMKREQDFLVLDIDRQTSTILKVYNPKQTQMALIVGGKKELRLNWVQKIVRLQYLTKGESEFIDQIKKSGRQCCLAFVSIYDQCRQRRTTSATAAIEANRPLQQFVVPFDTDINMFSDLVQFIKDKLGELRGNPANNLDSMDIDSLKLWTIEYNHKMNTSRGQIFWNQFEWRNPILQHEITEDMHQNQVNDLLEQRNALNEENESYQPYSSTPTGSGAYHFIYLAAQLHFDDPMPEASKKKPENTAVRGIALGGQQQEQDEAHKSCD